MSFHKYLKENDLKQMEDQKAREILNSLYSAVTDIYEQYDEGQISAVKALEGIVESVNGEEKIIAIAVPFMPKNKPV